MGMAVTYYTADMVRALPDDGQRYEVGGDTLVQPDLFVVPLGEARTLDWSQMRTLLLAVEVLSPSTARADRFTKRRLYQEVGIPTYWIVDPDARTLEVWTPSATLPAVENTAPAWVMMVPTMVPPPAALIVAALPTCQ